MKLVPAAFAAILAAGGFLISPCEAAFANSSITFPGKVATITSPDGQIAIKSLDLPLATPNEAPNRQLILVQKGHPQVVLLDSYIRAVDVLWSPDSTAFVLNRWTTSSDASTYLYHMDDLAHPLEIAPKLLASVKNANDKHNLDTADHLYIFASAWKSPASLSLKAAGHEGAHAFTLSYLWDLKNKFEFISRSTQENLTTEIPQS